LGLKGFVGVDVVDVLTFMYVLLEKGKKMLGTFFLSLMVLWQRCDFRESHHYRP